MNIGLSTFAWDVLSPRHMVTPGQISSLQHDAMMQDFQQYDVGAELLVGTFDNQGQAYLYHIGPLANTLGLVHLFEFPGYWAIGSGSYNAITWLNHRRQVLRRSVRQSAYHAYEGKKMAESSPTVNDDIELLIATPTGRFHLMRGHDATVRGQETEDRLPIGLSELET